MLGRHASLNVQGFALTSPSGMTSFVKNKEPWIGLVQSLLETFRAQ